MEPQIGEVYEFVEKRPHERHYFGIVSKREDGAFDCCMFTTSTTEEYPDNVPLQRQHISVTNEQGEPYKFQYRNSYFVSALLIKPVNFLNIRKAGELTEEGLLYVKAHKADVQSMEWEEYRRRP